MLTVVEKVLLLSEVDIFAETRAEDLAVLAGVAREEELGRGEVIHVAGEVADGMLVVAEGKVRLERPGGPETIVTRGAIGTWGLFDTAPRTCTATTAERTRFLTIGREAFADVLSDHVRITQAVLKVLSARVRRDVMAHQGKELTHEDINLG